MASKAIVALMGLLLMGVFGAEVSASLVLTLSGGDAAAQPRESGSAVSRKLLQDPDIISCPGGFTVCTFAGQIQVALARFPTAQLCCPGNTCPALLSVALNTCVRPPTASPTPTPTPTKTPKPSPTPSGSPGICPATFTVCTFAGQIQLLANFPTVQLCCPGTTCPATLAVALNVCIRPPTASPTPTPTPTPSPTPIATTPAGCPIGGLLCPVNASQLGVTLFTCCKLSVCPSSDNLAVLEGPLCAFPPIPTPTPSPTA